MKVSHRMLGAWKSELLNLQCRAESLLRRIERIILLGIILNLLVLILILWVLFSIKPLRYNTVEKPMGSIRATEGMKNTRKENTLDSILEIVCPVGMVRVAPSGSPASEASFFVCSSRSFGADQCASSEGFLVTFTPGWWRIVIFCDYPRLSEDLRKSFHFSQIGLRPLLELDGSGVGASQLRTRNLREPEMGYGANRGDDNSIINLLEIGVRHNLMMTSPPTLGILVALKPTDEGRIGTGRNTLRKNDES
jgi:hypothetical protein